MHQCLSVTYCLLIYVLIGMLVNIKVGMNSVIDLAYFPYRYKRLTAGQILLK